MPVFQRKGMEKRGNAGVIQIIGRSWPVKSTD